jgi:HPt (histidine-containing phosphotransfer) domain-containing protein
VEIVTLRKDRSAEDSETHDLPVIDRACLARYTMHNPDLEREIIKLFLDQLPISLQMLRDSLTAADWKLAAHTIKGSAAAVGAGEINRLATELEKRAPWRSDPQSLGLIAELETAIGRFDAVARRIFD